MEADQVWRGRGNGSAQTIRILTVSLDRQRVTFERLEGAPASALHKSNSATRSQIEASFVYDGETMSRFED